MKLNRKPSLTLLADCIPSPCSRTLQTHTLNTGGAERAVSLNHGARCAPNCGRKPWILMPRCESLRPGEIYEGVRPYACLCTHMMFCWWQTHPHCFLYKPANADDGSFSGISLAWVTPEQSSCYFRQSWWRPDSSEPLAHLWRQTRHWDPLTTSTHLRGSAPSHLTQSGLTDLSLVKTAGGEHSE